ncbi:MAG TPA: hypothetical protein PLB31_10845 [Fimbriimonadaceae bacterium]|nr:hypothetical protein [Fimbriimonadaceae bacterium]HRE93007.1 hypothetical protein [Fimbriimonadaceae bacterium]HRI74955.1 hypothetical protein [Fimbriimonadaceae bacterium]
MTKCPNCDKTIPHHVDQCMFCGCVVRATQGYVEKRTNVCPNCEMILKDTTEICPSCGTNVMYMARSTKEVMGFSYSGKAPPFAWPLYYVISGYWVLAGIASIALPMLVGIEGGSCFGIVQALLGIGLLLRVNRIRRWVNWICFLGLAFGLLSIGFSLLALIVDGKLGFEVFAFGLMTVATNGLMIWVIGLTQDAFDDFD